MGKPLSKRNNKVGYITPTPVSEEELLKKHIRKELYKLGIYAPSKK